VRNEEIIAITVTVRSIQPRLRGHRELSALSP
jgi:hypothetical protein